MSASVKSILQAALRLPSGDRAALVDGLIDSLDQSEVAVDALWLREGEDRMAAYRAGGLGAVDAEIAFVELGQRVCALDYLVPW